MCIWRQLLHVNTVHTQIRSLILENKVYENKTLYLDLQKNIWFKPPTLDYLYALLLERSPYPSKQYNFSSHLMQYS